MDYKEFNNIWFISDTHFGHGNIIKYCHRPFLTKYDIKALEENGGTWHDGLWKGEFSSKHYISKEAINLMDSTIIDNINKCVQPDDLIWHLGDVLFAPKDKYVERCQGYLDRINCKNINLIWGNHDHRSIKHLFNETYDLVKIHLPNQRSQAILCHYALAVWDGSHRGNWNLYGHSHTTAEGGLDAHFPDRKSIDVGVDNAYRLFGEFRPFSLIELQKILNPRMGHVLDHHTPRNLTTPTEH